MFFEPDYYKIWIIKPGPKEYKIQKHPHPS